MIIRSGVDDDLMLVYEAQDSKALDFNIEILAIPVIQKSSLGTLVSAGCDHIHMKVAGRQFRVTSTSFFQVNTLQAREMVEHITTYPPVNNTMTVINAYCGVGLFSAFLASKVKQRVGIELSPEACDDFINILDGIDTVSLYEASAVEVLFNVSFKPDAVIVDPPREGLGRKTVESIVS